MLVKLNFKFFYFFFPLNVLMYYCTVAPKHQLGRCYIKSINLDLNLAFLEISVAEKWARD